MSDMMNKLSGKLGLKDDDNEKMNKNKTHAGNAMRGVDLKKDVDFKTNKKEKAGRGYVDDWKTSMD